MIVASRKGCPLTNTNSNKKSVGGSSAQLAALWLMAVAFSASSHAQQAEPYQATDEGITKPRLVTRVDPDYTPEARAARIQGTVSTSVVIGSSGHIDKITLIKGVDPGLDANAVAAIQQWTFEPGTKDGRPVAVQVKIDVTFHLK